MMFSFSVEEVINSFHDVDPMRQAETFLDFSRRIDKGLQIINEDRDKEENILYY